MKYKIEKWNNKYYLYTKSWWFPFWVSEHTSPQQFLPMPPFPTIERAEEYLKKYYINTTEVVKEGEI